MAARNNTAAVCRVSGITDGDSDYMERAVSLSMLVPKHGFPSHSSKAFMRPTSSPYQCFLEQISFEIVPISKLTLPSAYRCCRHP